MRVLTLNLWGDNGPWQDRMALLEDEGRLASMGARAREHVRGLYDERVLLPAFVDFWARTARRR